MGMSDEPKRPVDPLAELARLAAELGQTVVQAWPPIKLLPPNVVRVLTDVGPDACALCGSDDCESHVSAADIEGLKKRGLLTDPSRRRTIVVF